MSKTNSTRRFTVHDGGAGRPEQDDEAYAAIAEACERALSTMNLSPGRARRIRRCAVHARRAAYMPPSQPQSA